MKSSSIVILFVCFLCGLHTALGDETAIDAKKLALIEGKPIDVTRNSLPSFLEGLDPTQGLLMEFYAHWCPACQHFAPQYEIVGKYFNSEPKVKPEITVARIDCADETILCGNFNILKYPTLKYGLPSAFQDGHTDQLQEYPDTRLAPNIIAWIGTQKGVEYNYNASLESQSERKSSKKGLVGVDPGVPLLNTKEADLHDLEKATSLAIKYATSTPELLKSPESKTVLKEFIDLIAQAHPIERCRVGATKLSSTMDGQWLISNEGNLNVPSSLHVCGADAEQKDWRMCKGSKEGKRGYTCGLWALFHSLSTRVEPEENGGSLWISAIRGYVAHFFQCSDCAKHFGEMASEQAASDVKSRKEGVMWMWRAHNEVNRRLEAEESISGDKDPAFPKQQWPSKDLCPLCRLPSLDKAADVMWNQDEVYRFLLKFYLGNSEGHWVSQKLTAGQKMLKFSGRKAMPGTTESAKHHGHIGRYLLLIIVGCILVFVARQRSQKTSRKIVSL